MEINNDFEPTREQVKVTADYYQEVYRVRERISAREKSIASDMDKFNALQAEKDEVFQRITEQHYENGKDKAWLENARPPFEDSQNAKILPFLFPNTDSQPDQDTAA